MAPAQPSASANADVALACDTSPTTMAATAKRNPLDTHLFPLRARAPAPRRMLAARRPSQRELPRTPRGVKANPETTTAPGMFPGPS